MNIKTIPPFLEKVKQLYEMLAARHGVMIVGRPFSGKSEAVKLLAATLTDQSKSDNSELPVRISVVNPKAVAPSQLFGCFDEVSRDWGDGVLSKVFRDFSRDLKNERKWIVLDGPVDVTWVESLNTVLDDNRKLCLISGEVLPMKDNMKIIIEAVDLKCASPATVSRCGVVYFDPDKMGYQFLVQTWMEVGELICRCSDAIMARSRAGVANARMPTLS
eukprot:GHVU01133148.1.p2 GENE.GHVU01133148.1~~GHVU01133148.1.p2  ORF type:complete len:218 (+),score=35.82 GHVU01133148.1:3108-3761(+)